MTAEPLPPAEDLERLRARYLVAAEAVQVSSDRTIDALVSARRAREIAIEHAGQGRRMSELEDVIDPHVLRVSLGGALAELERTRHDAQRLLFQLMQAEGMTLADIGRAYGISRQLVSRLVNEPDPPGES
jgi:hypothetical protein